MDTHNYSEIGAALKEAWRKLNPCYLRRNLVMLIVEGSALFTLVVALCHFFMALSYRVALEISIWLWLTVLSANFAESWAEQKGKAQAATLKKQRNKIYAQRLVAGRETQVESVPALLLGKGDIVVVSAGMLIPSDGEIMAGVALIDESAITGESAPVVREAGGDKSMVTGGTKVLSGKIKVMIQVNPGETFIEQMVQMITNVTRQKTPNELALEILLVGLALLFIVVTITLSWFGAYLHLPLNITTLIALMVSLIPTTISGLLPAIGIAGMDHLLTHNIVALTGRASEAAGDINMVVLDKTGTITLGNRLATAFIPAKGVREQELARSAMLASLADDTPEGRSIVILAKARLQLRGRELRTPPGARFLKFQAETRISGIDINGLQIRKGAIEALEDFTRSHKIAIPHAVQIAAERVAHEGSTPLIVADQKRVYGVVVLKDVVKEGVRQRLGRLHRMGVSSLMVTGDNPLTAATVAVAAGVDDFVAQATPALKVELIKKYQQDGYIVAMLGDGANDALALAQADVAVALNAGMQAAREAANMVDLDSNPTKIVEIVKIGKQILITRGALTTFTIANDIAKYFALIPALFVNKCNYLGVLNIMQLSNPTNAVIAAVIFNALIIPLLIPLALHGVHYRETNAVGAFQKNILVYGLGGVVLPFIGIKLIDLALIWLAP